MKVVRKFLPWLISGIVLVATVPVVGAYEGHLVDVRAHLKGEPLLATRSYGFWRTHLDYAEHVFNHPDHLNGEMDIGWRNIEEIEELMGVFWAKTNKDEDGSPRSELCKAKVIAARQAAAAILNSALSNGAPLPVTLLYIQTTLAGTNITLINELQATLESYNLSGDNVGIDDNDNFPIGGADPQVAEAMAEIDFVDCP